MILEKIDWGVIVLYFLSSISIAIIMPKRAGRIADDFFLPVAQRQGRFCLC
jgi:hypothetical protein